MTRDHDAPDLIELQRQVSELNRTVAALVHHLSAAVGLLQSPGSQDQGCLASSWDLRQPRRNDALSYPIFLVLKDAHQRGLPKPTAMGVMNAFGVKRPPEVVEIMPREVKYLSLSGDLKSAGLDDIRSRIYRMTSGKSPVNRTFAAQT